MTIVLLELDTAVLPKRNVIPSPPLEVMSETPFLVGMLSAWDTRQNKCFIHWEADTSEIGRIRVTPPH